MDAERVPTQIVWESSTKADLTASSESVRATMGGALPERVNGFDAELVG
jgi:hypothetical protein